MRHLTPLRKIDYMIPFSSFARDFMDETKMVPQHLPLLNLNIDFEKGALSLEGDWQFMVNMNGHNQKDWFCKSRERVQIDVSIFGLLPIDLADPTFDGLVLPLEGVITDHFGTGSCSGMLVIDNVRLHSGLISDEWYISVYLYDQQQNNMEIKVTLPVLTGEPSAFEHTN